MFRDEVVKKGDDKMGRLVNLDLTRKPGWKFSWKNGIIVFSFIQIFSLYVSITNRIAKIMLLTSMYKQIYVNV